MMITSILSASLLLCVSLLSCDAKPLLASPGVFGIARGGGLFGDKKGKR